MAERKSLSKKTRFEVFKRDSFTCQYCGSKAPDVILEIDHIEPKSKGGIDEIINLLTSCFDCNRGKSNRKINDNSIVEKQRIQIEELNIRRQQLEMMLKWRDGEIELKNMQYEKAIDYFNSFFDSYQLNDNGEKTITNLVRKHGLLNVLENIDLAIQKYYKNDEDFEKVYVKLQGIIHCQSLPEHMQKISYIMGICKNKWPNYTLWPLKKLIVNYYEENYCLDKLTEMLKNNEFKNYSSFKTWLQ